MVEKFVDQVLARTPSATIDIVQQITDCIAELDDRISAQLNEVMHHQEFQKLEASGVACMILSWPPRLVRN